MFKPIKDFAAKYPAISTAVAIIVISLAAMIHPTLGPKIACSVFESAEIQDLPDVCGQTAEEGTAAIVQ